MRQNGKDHVRSATECPKSENLKAVELFLTTRALFHTLKVLGLQAEQAGAGDRQIQTNEREIK